MIEADELRKKSLSMIGLESLVLFEGRQTGRLGGAASRKEGSVVSQALIELVAAANAIKGFKPLLPSQNEEAKYVSGCFFTSVTLQIASCEKD